MSSAKELQGAYTWNDVDLQDSRRWVKEHPSSIPEEIYTAISKVKDFDWSEVNRDNFCLPSVPAFFDDAREELEMALEW